MWRLLLILMLLPGLQARAEAPVVAVDIPPVAGLVAAVMDGVGAPTLLLGAGGSPHGGALRPSEARALQEADLVIWIGPSLTPWLAHAITALAPGTPRLTLLDDPATARLPARDAAVFTPADAGLDAPSHGPMHGSAPGGITVPVDPHAWLDPVNARAWLAPIADALSGADPANAAVYAANARAADRRIATAARDATAALAPVRDVPFLVAHDAFRYFEHAFGLRAAGAVTLGDASAPGPAQIAGLRESVAKIRPACIFLEPGQGTALVATVLDGQQVRRSELDPLGRILEPGPRFYETLLAHLADTALDCLSPAPLPLRK